MTFFLVIVGIAICWIAYKNDTLNFKYYLRFWNKSFDFKGNINRKQYWITQGWSLITLIFLVLIGLSIFFDTGMKVPKYNYWNEFIGYSYPLAFIRGNFGLREFIGISFYSWVMVSFIPSLSVQIRRLRDAARNPWWILISFVPFLGGIVLLIFYLSPSRKKRLPMTLQNRLSEVEDLIKKGTIDEEEYKYMRKQILSKHIN